MFFSVIIFLAVLFVLILVHEWGHYIVAKLTGMRVDEFGIGFPPRLFSFRRGETTYTLNALPIGGFVRIYGENPDEVKSEGGENHLKNDATRAFGARPTWAQVLVLMAGVTMNLLFAWFLFVVLLLLGIQTTVDEGQQSTSAQLLITAVLPHSPAEGVLPANSFIRSVVADSETLSSLTPSAFSNFMMTHPEAPLFVTYEKAGVTKTVSVVPHGGVLSSTSSQPAIGVALSLVELTQYPLGTALVQATHETQVTTVLIVHGLASLLSGMITGTADYSQVSGPVGIVGYVGDAAAVGFTSLLYFMAIISINLAVINLLPIPALDGGRIIFVAIEAVIRRPLNPVWAGRINFAGFALLMLLMVVVTAHDILKLW